MNSKRYNNTKLALNIIEGILTFILIYFFVAAGFSDILVKKISIYVSNIYLQFIIFAVIVGGLLGIIFLPINYYSNYYLEHKYKLSNQTLYKWIWENTKGLFVSAAIGLPLLVFFFFVLNRFGTTWWLPLSIGLFFLSVILAQLVPVLILPIFYKVTPFQNEELKTRISNLAYNAGIKVSNIYSFDMSKNTKKANAAFTGLGKTKRILLGDTLIQNYSNAEIETVIAHELGHYKKKHIVKNLILGTFFSFFSLYLMAILYENSIGWFGFHSINQIAAIPILSLWAMLVGLIVSPTSNAISRKFEYEADQYAIDVTKKVSEFKSVLEKLTDQNLGDREPHPFVEWFFYSHPSIKKRILAIEKYALFNGFN
ncbi:MAG: M48 family metallopeptidase [Ignavibacteriaceae bacterium]|nr:M48 family metallopeptidase [Ignavibacteriaceae bacterium]